MAKENASVLSNSPGDQQAEVEAKDEAEAFLPGEIKVLLEKADSTPGDVKAM